MHFERGRFAFVKGKTAIATQIAWDDQGGEIKETDGNRRLLNVEEVLSHGELMNEELKLKEVVARLALDLRRS